MLRTPGRIGAVVAAGVVVVTIVLAVLAWRVEEGANRELLDRQVEQAATVLGGAVNLQQVRLTHAGQVATADGTESFRRFAEPQIAPEGPFASLSLMRITDGRAELLTNAGAEPRLPEGGLGSAFFGRSAPAGQLVVAGLLPGEPTLLAGALRPDGDDSGLLVYSESVVTPEPQPRQEDDVAFGGLDFAVYLGETVDPDQLVISTAPTPIGGETQRATLPYGDTVLTIVGSASGSLAGGLSAALPWVVLAVGGVLALLTGLGVAALSRRRAVAEDLAAENARLYERQRGIAGTLQHAMLPEVPAMDGLEATARYVSGVDELDVGGDWYDVITRGPGRCVFVVGDISGRGLEAATTMAALRFAARAYLEQGDDVGTVVTKLHRLLRVEDGHQFATVLIGELDGTEGRLRLVCAGHFPPLLVSGGRTVVLDCPVAPPVGVGSPDPVVTELSLPAAGTLLAFTDGLVERRGEVIDTGLARLSDAAAAGDGQPLEQYVDGLMQTLTADGGKDDTVLVGLRWTR